MSIKSLHDNLGTTSAVLWPDINFYGTGLPVSNGQAGYLAVDTGVWSYKSAGIIGMQLFAFSETDTASPDYSYTGHTETVLISDEPDLPVLFAAATCPLKFIGVDPSQVAVLMVDVAAGDTAVAIAPSQSFPITGIPMATFAAPGKTGALGFVATSSGSSTVVAVQYGNYSAGNGTAAWSGYGSLTVSWNGAAPVVSGLSGLPANWSFSAPVKQADGSWRVTLSTQVATDTGLLYTGTGYTGSSTALSPHVLKQLNSGFGWTYNSLKLFDMQALIYSSFAPTNTSYSFTNYQQQLLTTDISNFATTFTGTSPVSLLSLDNSDVVVSLVVNTTGTTDSALVLTQTYPQAFYNFASTSQSGLLAVLPATGAAQAINISYGNLDGSGLFKQQGSGTVSVALVNGVPVITAQSDLPANWNFGEPTQQPDGTWRVSVSDAQIISSLSVYPQVNYGGTPTVLTEHSPITVRSIAGMWAYDSVKVGSLRWLSSTLFTPQSTTYDFRQYRDSYSAVDVADISQAYPLASPLIAGVALGPDDVVVRVHLSPQDATQKVVLSATQNWPIQSTTASVNFGGVSHDGILAIFDKTQPIRTIQVQIGALNADGTAVWQRSTSVTVHWDQNLLQPIITLGADAPESWQLVGMQATAQEGEYETFLAFDSHVNVNMYPITNAPAIDNAGSDAGFTPYNKVALYCEHAVALDLSLSGSAKFKSNDLQSCTIELDAFTMTTIEFYDQQQETVLVTLSGEYVDTQYATINFTPFDFNGHLRLKTNNGAPATGSVRNSVYFDTKSINRSSVDITLSGSAVFADTYSQSKTFDLHEHSYDCTFDVVNSKAETITVKAEVFGYSSIKTDMTFVNANI